MAGIWSSARWSRVLRHDPGIVMEIGRQAIEVTLLIAAPCCHGILVVGLIISIFQAATQFNESTLFFVPKLVAMFVVLLLLAGPWMLQYLIDYIQRLFGSIRNSSAERMISIDSAQIDAWIVAFIFPLSRILGFIRHRPVEQQRRAAARAAGSRTGHHHRTDPSLPPMPAVQPTSWWAVDHGPNC